MTTSIKHLSPKAAQEHLADVFIDGVLPEGACHSCGKPAIWSYMPGDAEACDDCVPRGCSCNEEPADGDYENASTGNFVQPLDARGRQFPCCEWMPLVA